MQFAERELRKLQAQIPGSNYVIAFANSDLSGIMDHRASITEARRAVQQILSLS